MKTPCFIQLLTFSASLLLCKPALAQNIRGDTVYVNATSKVAIVFPAAPSRADLSVKDGSYEVDEAGKSALSVKASKRSVKDQTLEVTEGRRKHLFVLSYKEELPMLRIDHSNLKKLKAYVEQRKKAASKALVEANTSYEKQLWEKAQIQYQQLVYAVEGKETDLVNARLLEIRNHLQAITEKKYKEAMDLGITYGKDGKYAEAKRAFKEALVYKPGDSLALISIKAADQGWFKECVKNGDEAYSRKNYIAAKMHYQEALSMRPDDRTVQDKFNQAKKKADPQIYQLMKNKGDSAYGVNDLIAARKAYDSARVVKPDDKYTQAQISTIIKVEEFNGIVDKANSLAATATTVQQFDLAISEYRRALVLLPHRDYPKDQIKELMLKRESVAKQSSNEKN